MPEVSRSGHRGEGEKMSALDWLFTQGFITGVLATIFVWNHPIWRRRREPPTIVSGETVIIFSARASLPAGPGAGI